MTFTDELVKFIGDQEGFAPRAYLDPKGNTLNQYSIGYGHLIKPFETGSRVIKINRTDTIPVVGSGGRDTTITQQQAYQLFLTDLQSYIRDTESVISNTIWPNLTDKQKVALVSYTYNAGKGSASRGTGLSGFFNSPTNGFKAALEAKNYLRAGEILRDYGVRTADGVVEPALVRRRKLEGELLAGVTLTDTAIVDALPPVNGYDVYFDTTYIKALRTAGLGLIADRIAIKELKAPYETQTNPRPIQDVVRDTALINESQLEGELTLLQGVGSLNVEFERESKEILSRIDNFLPAESAFLVEYDLFEFYPDLMRQEMSANAGNGQLVDYTHAWRAPGKLAITADITIPGASGFRIGQIFWVGRTYEHYKQFGAFQLFGLTETIDINKGWTTQLHARFNVMPTVKIAGLQSE